MKKIKKKLFLKRKEGQRKEKEKESGEILRADTIAEQVNLKSLPIQAWHLRFNPWNPSKGGGKPTLQR